MSSYVKRNLLEVGLPVAEHTGDVLSRISVATSHERLLKERQRQVVPWMRKALREREFLTD